MPYLLLGLFSPYTRAYMHAFLVTFILLPSPISNPSSLGKICIAVVFCRDIANGSLKHAN